MNDILSLVQSITDPKLLKEVEKLALDRFKVTRSEQRKKKDPLAVAEALRSSNEAVKNAQKEYESQGLFVDLETDKNGLIKKWKLRNRRPKNKIEVDDAVRTRQVTVPELKTIIPSLPQTFSAKDIQDALSSANIGKRKLQPTWGTFVKTTNSGIEKVPGVDKGPGVRYRKSN